MTQPLPESPDRLKGSLETLFRLMGPRAAYTIQWRGKVLLAVPPTPSPAFVAAAYLGPASYSTPGYVNVQLVDAEALEVLGPSFSSSPIPLWGDASGFVSVPTVGSWVRVGFANASPAYPYIAGTDPMTFPTVSAGVILRAYGAVLTGVAAGLGVVG